MDDIWSYFNYMNMKIIAREYISIDKMSVLWSYINYMNMKLPAQYYTYIGTCYKRLNVKMGVIT